MTIYIVRANDYSDMYGEIGHDWCIGVFSSEEKAQEAIANDKVRYSKQEFKDENNLDYVIIPIELDKFLLDTQI